jgi:hypothetical protein
MANRKNTFILKRSNVAGKIPSAGDLLLGEIAINTADVILYASGTTTNSILPIGWDRVARTGDTVTGNFNFKGDMTISGSSLPSGYALSVTGDTNFVGDVYVRGDLSYSGNVLVTGSTIIQNGLTANTIYTDYIDLNTAYTGATKQGRLSWDSGTGTLNIGVGDVGGTLIDLQVGQEEIVRVFNSEATTLQRGEIVYVFGSQGNRPSVKRAIATADGYSVTTLGMVTSNIASGSEGYVTTFGIISNLNTSGLTGGTAIWLSPTVAGAYTSTKPQAPYHTVLIGYVVRTGTTVGSVFVNISNGWEIDELHDVRLNGRTLGDLLTLSAYNGTNVWVNSKTLNGSYTVNGGLTITGNTNISGNTTVGGAISATTYLNLPTDIRVTGATYSNNAFTYTNNTGGTFNVLFNTLTGLTVNGDLTVTGSTIVSGNTTVSGDVISLQYLKSLNSNGEEGGEIFLNKPQTGTTLNGGVTVDVYQNKIRFFEQGGTARGAYIDLTACIGGAGTNLLSGGGGEVNTASNLGTGTGLFAQKSGVDLQFKSLTSTGGTVTISNNSTTVNLEVVPASNFTGGTVAGATNFTGGLTANTISATTYQNLPIDITVTGGTYSASVSTIIFRNNTGGTFNVTGITATGGGTTFTGGTVTGATSFTNGLSANTFSSSTLNTPITNTQVVYSNSGTLTGSTNLTWVNSAATLTINGTLEATSKSFSIPHPTKEGKKLVYGSLEGPENGIYHRGKLYKEDVILLPEYWYKLIDKDSVTVHLTPIGKHQDLFVKEILEDRVIIGIEGGLFTDKTINCFYVVYGERKDINKLEVER